VIYWFDWNPIYPSLVAMAAGGAASLWCRPDLKTKAWVGSLLFLGLYVIFLKGLEWTAPGYIDRVWAFSAISGIRVWAMPIEELLFAAAFGFYWSGLYEHYHWLAPAGSGGKEVRHGHGERHHTLV